MINNWQIERYVELIYKHNQMYNLTGFRSLFQIKLGLVDEIMAIINDLNLPNDQQFNLLDIGSGAGSPGIILALSFPQGNFHLLEASKKKVNFLNLVIQSLELKNVRVSWQRAELLEHSFHQESYDFGISRAVASIKIMNELFAQWIKVNGMIIHLKSISFESEVKNAEPFLKSLGLKHFVSKQTIFNGKILNNVIYQKLKKTPRKFPRSWKQIISKENDYA